MSRRDSDSEKVPAALYDRLTDTPTYAARMYKVQPRTFIERHTFDHLESLEELKLLNSSSWSPVKFPELVISKESPLYQSIRSGETIPSSYQLVEAAGD